MMKNYISNSGGIKKKQARNTLRGNKMDRIVLREKKVVLKDVEGIKYDVKRKLKVSRNTYRTLGAPWVKIYYIL